MGLSTDESRTRIYEQELGARERYRNRVAWRSVRCQVYRIPAAQYMGRGRLRPADHRNGNRCAVCLASLDRRAPVYGVARTSTASPDSFIPDWLRDSLVCVLASLPAYLWRHGPLPKFRHQCISVASGWDSLSPARATHANTRPGRRRL